MHFNFILKIFSFFITAYYRCPRFYNILIIKDKAGNIVGKQTISIEITADVSNEQIIQFIKDNKNEIKYWQNQLKLPKHNHLNWKDLSLGIAIINMRDKKDMSFDDIASYYSENEKLRKENKAKFNKLCDEGYIKVLYYRYKKRLQIK